MSQGNKAEAQEPAQRVTYVALEPRRGLTIILALVFAAWVALLVTWYVTTVRPVRHQQPSITQPTETRP
jgi:hypothetical protein